MPNTRSRGKPLAPYNPELKITLRRAMNAQEREEERFQQLSNAQARGNNQHTTNNENDDVDRNELNEQNVEDVAPGNHCQPQRGRG
ncbi:hypothetical protein HAX54_019350, partial [Datura stramonium]|nr:hypothetical protein [Datura stramonium]